MEEIKEPHGSMNIQMQKNVQVQVQKNSIQVQKAKEYVQEDLKIEDGRKFVLVPKKKEKSKRKLKRIASFKRRMNEAPAYPIIQHVFEYYSSGFKKQVNVEEKIKADESAKIQDESPKVQEHGKKEHQKKEEMKAVGLNQKEEKNKAMERKKVVEKRKKDSSKKRRSRWKLSKHCRGDSSNLDDSSPEMISDIHSEVFSLNLMGRKLAFYKDQYSQIRIEKNGSITIKNQNSQNNHYLEKGSKNLAVKQH